ncbi:bifunctional ADP-dependent NAD(P)H-hydrate dehydratase/NAD(P)H-hydrate epimerase [Prochlorothrix hollandica]|uniref:Bifunctional NAD(P)H-hydrate repair enzyme n=1 Tax=Prochlorothrix hollandica PCC 9006 = CALU 1027 TaxID=317619 RepID=A0A0M2Q182_PROHO|nr:bifunctional ADP-dependent NAD(P)H-hydrate dehydratase/NAD(P)H-hydrate epimerase [Prochlorothrix hollandica]KKJ00377.1 NAD(P)H-hydrate epimerase [Prochlorothrix hollandica PCC 9006 = CALU 1027]
MLQDTAIVTTAQMQAIEQRLFTAGLPVAALMEKVAGLISRRIWSDYPRDRYPRVGILAGPGHNGGDAWVVARELHLAGYAVAVWCPLARLKPLTADHRRYGLSLGIGDVTSWDDWGDRQLWIDGLFGFGLERPLAGAIAAGVETLNQITQGTGAAPVVSLDLPSGLHTDSGQILGTAVRASHTLCLGLWKRGLLHETALGVVGRLERVDFGIPAQDIAAVLGENPPLQRLTPAIALASLPWTIPPDSHKYRRGHLLLVAGSRRYRGAVLLAALGSRASGVGMLSIAVPHSLQEQVSSQIPEALVIPCPETEAGAIADFPPELHQDLGRDRFSTVVLGPGLSPAAAGILLPLVLPLATPLLLDADGLGALALSVGAPALADLRPQGLPTVLTPHGGEFRRLFPALDPAASPQLTPGDRATLAAHSSGAIVVLKGARTAIAHPQGVTWINPDSTPALARGGSGDGLAGLMGGLMAIAQAQGQDPGSMVKTAVWWHSQAALQLAQRRSVLGVDAWHLGQGLGDFIGTIAPH